MLLGQWQASICSASIRFSRARGADSEPLALGGPFSTSFSNVSTLRYQTKLPSLTTMCMLILSGNKTLAKRLLELKGYFYEFELGTSGKRSRHVSFDFFSKKFSYIFAFC